ncbi:MAG: gliding motility lipoprotein GldD [Prevotellaceae bacterium]|jgi:gliding motility-associated lipoprotein GldD|nr:gliding motility lipoprotein GldD [Prevotellaceae bacterium]
MNKTLIFTTLAAIFTFAACSRSAVPKPVGYPRFDLPAKQYRIFDSLCPYSFDIPVYAQMIPNTGGKFWFDLYFPQYAATIYLSYLPVTGNLDKLLDHSHQFVYFHTDKADAIEAKLIVNDGSIGLLSDIGGDSATPMQFFVTDSVRHFLRGSLYFYSVPNRDSLLPLINFLREDIERLMNSVKFKSQH